MLGNSWVAAQLAASQEGFSSMELVAVYWTVNSEEEPFIFLIMVVNLINTFQTVTGNVLFLLHARYMQGETKFSHRRTVVWFPVKTKSKMLCNTSWDVQFSRYTSSSNGVIYLSALLFVTTIDCALLGVFKRQCTARVVCDRVIMEYTWILRHALSKS
jgi:hypothetical protein